MSYETLTSNRHELKVGPASLPGGEPSVHIWLTYTYEGQPPVEVGLQLDEGRFFWLLRTLVEEGIAQFGLPEVGQMMSRIDAEVFGVEIDEEAGIAAKRLLEAGIGAEERDAYIASLLKEDA